jgi:tetratricopeptide (TPR) repeat protein
MDPSADEGRMPVTRSEIVEYFASLADYFDIRADVEHLGFGDLSNFQSAVVYKDQNQPHAAIECLTDMMEHPPLVQFFLADSYIGAKQPFDALDIYHAMLRTDPDNPQILSAHIVALAQAQMHEDVIKAADDYLQKHGENLTLLNYRAGAYFSLNKTEKGISDLEKTLHNTSDKAGVHFALAHGYKKIGQLDKAVRHMRSSIRHDSNDIDAYSFLGDIYQESGRFESAVNWLERGARLDADNEIILTSLAHAQLAAGHFNDAVHTTSRLVFNAPNDDIAYTLRAEAYEELGRYDDARADLEHALSITKDQDTLHQLCYLHIKIGTIQRSHVSLLRARELSLQLQSLDPDNHKHLRMEGDILKLLGERRGARARYRKAKRKAALID